jgi:hypothetical protein
MRVRLKFATIDDLPPDTLGTLHEVPRLKAMGFDGRFAPIGTEFTVYGIDFAEGNVLYRVGNPPREEYAIQCLAALFEIVDERVSRYWHSRMLRGGRFVLWPPSWFTDYYHDRLSDGDPVISADFAEVRQLLGAEGS